MCGIAAISMSHNDNVMDARAVAKSLLQGIAHRGPDATGAAWYDHDSDSVKLTKVAVPAWRFIEARGDVFPQATSAMVMHTRFATHGKKDDRRNNHPVVHENIIGVHNGVLQNHKALFEKWGVKPTAEVDSEALMMLLNQEVEGEPVHPTAAFGDMKGDAAIGWIDLRNPETLHLANVVGRPMHILQTKQGSLLMGSEEKTVKNAAKDNGLEIAFYKVVPEETYLRVSYGVIEEWLGIENVYRPSDDFTKKYAYTSGHGASSAKPVAPKPDAVKSTVEEAVKEVADSKAEKAGVTVINSKPIEQYTDAELIIQEKHGNKRATEELNRRVYVEFLSGVDVDRLRKMVASEKTDRNSKVLIGQEIARKVRAEQEAAKARVLAKREAAKAEDHQPMALTVDSQGVVEKTTAVV